MSTRASGRSENSSRFKSSSRAREWKDSTNGFCHGAPVDVAGGRALRLTPVDERGGGYLRAVVAADVRRRATNRDQPLEHRDGLIGAGAAGGVRDQRLARELVDDVAQLEHVPVGALVELEVERPHIVGRWRGCFSGLLLSYGFLAVGLVGLAALALLRASL